MNHSLTSKNLRATVDIINKRDYYYGNTTNNKTNETLHNQPVLFLGQYPLVVESPSLFPLNTMSS